jgi:hypothetical protein
MERHAPSCRRDVEMDRGEGASMPSARTRHPRMRAAAVRFLIAALILLVLALVTHLTIFAVLCAICGTSAFSLWLSSIKNAG